MAGANRKNTVVPGAESESFSLFWLDTEVNTADHNQKTQTLLRGMVNNLQTFDNLSECQKNIQSFDEKERLILIVSGKLGREIVPQVHNLRKVSSIYVYCMNKESNREWSQDFSKVKDVIVEQKMLLTRIKLDKKKRVEKKESISYNIYSITDRTDPSTIGLQNQFIHSLVITNMLLQLSPIPNEKQKLVAICKKDYTGDTNQLQAIREFNDEYTTSDQVLSWYTRDSFLYRMLNKALCQQDLNQLILFRMIISDMHYQLKQNTCELSVPVYYGQVMNSGEVKDLQNQANNFMSMKSFLWADTNKNKVLKNLHQRMIYPGDCHVLFTVNVDSNSKRFADISKSNSFIDQGEILFMIGTIFRIVSVTTVGKDDLKVEMKLCNGDEHELRPVFEYMKNENEDNKIDLYTFGNKLRQLGKYALAEKVYLLSVNELPSNDPLRSDIYCALGAVNKEIGDHDASLKWFKQSLESKKKTNPSDLISIGSLYNCIGESHWSIGNDEEALKCFKKAVEQFQKAHAEDHSHMADFYSNIGSYYKRKQKYETALEFYQKALNIDRRQSCDDRLTVAKSHNEIGIVYSILKDYNRAIEHYQLSITIKLRILSPEHLSLGNSYKNIGYAYAHKGDLKQALKYYQQASTIFHRALPPGHKDLKDINLDIQKILKQL
ncbi:unnamed protein product [Adineta steineri]|uniref:Uncharacterized protein n=1 Tax=Adineta steineri TaxID=433720 RepID=A0A814TBN7_9BILA|nr:unnamed protein product [Adineta steineri]CAF3568664.1 unnamed protein product [Adineta steineri]